MITSFYPCSWYLWNDAVLPYEYCDQNLKFDEVQIKNQLQLLQQKGYYNYGVTIRPIQGVTEFETENGHIYVKTT